MFNTVSLLSLAFSQARRVHAVVLVGGKFSQDNVRVRTGTIKELSPTHVTFELGPGVYRKARMEHVMAVSPA